MVREARLLRLRNLLDINPQKNEMKDSYNQRMKFSLKINNFQMLSQKDLLKVLRFQNALIRSQN